MTLTLRAVSLNDQPLTQPITAHFEPRGGTIGRADHNTMALPDPERHISREQAEIIAGGSGYVIKNVGSSNPIMVRNQPLAHGESAPLINHDQVRIGRYLLEVVDESPAGGNDMDATTGVFAARAPVARAATHPGHLAAPLSPTNPFTDLLASPSTPAPARLPDDFDPFAMPASSPAKPRPEASAAGAFGDLIPSAESASIDEMFDLKGTTGGDPLAAFLSDVKVEAQGSASTATPGSTDPLVLFGAAPSAAPPPEVAPDRTPELRAAFIPPQPQMAAPRASASPAEVAEVAPVAAPWNGDAAALWRAFCEGAGVKVEPPEGVTPELMRLAGTLLRSTIEGTLQLIAMRSATRHELRANVTMIQARNNNPLKFSPDAQAALEQLLQPPLRGFMAGPAAVTEAMDDLVGHAIGTMAGTRSALEGVLARFAPQALEGKLVGKTVLDSLLPMAHRAKLWELYLQHYEGIREEAQEDFHALFGKAFVEAYQQQLEQLRRERPVRK
jgi:FHA domain-containing protein